jgi:hypothetical protein
VDLLFIIDGRKLFRPSLGGKNGKKDICHPDNNDNIPGYWFYNQRLLREAIYGNRRSR